MANLDIHHFSRKQVLPVSLEQNFDFFLRAENLHRITPDWLDFNLITPPPIDISRGTIIDYTIRLMGLRIRWRSMITRCDPPHGFTDEQLLGPFSFWQHRHEFEASSDGTVIHDSVYYALPNWLPSIISRLINRSFVAPRLNRIFDYRARQYAFLLVNQRKTGEPEAGQTSGNMLTGQIGV